MNLLHSFRAAETVLRTFLGSDAADVSVIFRELRLHSDRQAPNVASENGL
jgi:hypothetical protein